MRTNRSDSTSTSFAPLHHQVPLMPGQAQLAQCADLRVRHEASPKFCVRVRIRGAMPAMATSMIWLSKGTERSSVGLGEQHPSETLIVDQRSDERFQPGLRRTTRSCGPERIDSLRHHRDGMVDDGALEVRQGREAFVEVPLGESGVPTHPADADRAGTFCSGDRKGGLHQTGRRSLRRSTALIPLKGIVTW